MNLSITLQQPDKKLALFGTADRNLRMLRDALGVRLTPRDDQLLIVGDREQVDKAAAVVERMQKSLRRKEFLSPADMQDLLRDAARAKGEADAGAIDVFSGGHAVRAKTPGQARYIDAIFNHDLTFCTGPAGTGKTYLAVAAAASMLKRGQCKRIVLARPAVEAGERLGFLPGDLQAKVNPYLRPLFDALNDMIDLEQVKRFIMNDVIEVIPLAFMRGRTLNECAVIMDEAQNTTPSQMLMFLTRLGNESKMIVTGDTSQVDLDLDRGQESGLIDAIHRLRGVPGIARVALERSDIVRHPLVQNIVERYGAEETEDREDPTDFVE